MIPTTHGFRIPGAPAMAALAAARARSVSIGIGPAKIITQKTIA